MKKLSILTASLLCASSFYANAGSKPIHGMPSNFAMKFRAGFVTMGDKNFELKSTAGTSNTAGYYEVDSKTNFKSGYGVELAATYNFTENFAFETSIGYCRQNLEYNSNYTYHDGAAKTSNITTKKTIGIVPVNVTLLAQKAEGVIRPYIGAGYSLEFITNTPSSLKVKNGGGPLVQLGADLAATDSLNLNFDLKYAFLVAHKTTDNNIKSFTHGSNPAVSVAPVNKANSAKTHRMTAMLGVTFPF